MSNPLTNITDFDVALSSAANDMRSIENDTGSIEEILSKLRLPGAETSPNVEAFQKIKNARINLNEAQIELSQIGR